MRVDYLIMLLSTDWFIPHWSEIGLELDEKEKRAIQSECREIVKEFMGDAQSYYLIDFSANRTQKTFSALAELLERFGVKAEVIDEWWSSESQAGLSSSRMLRMLTKDLFSTNTTDDHPAPDFSIRAEILEASAEYDLSLGELAQIETASQSTWDLHLQGLFDGLTTVLSDCVRVAVTERRLRALWSRISERLSEEQLQQLISWYRADAKYRGVPGDPLPYYINDR